MNEKKKQTNKHCRTYYDFATYFLLVKFCQDRKFKIEKLTWKKVNLKVFSRQVCIFGFSLCSQTHRMMIQDLSFISGFSQIWLNLPRNDPHLFSILQWMIAILATNKKTPKKKHLNWWAMGVSHERSSWCFNRRPIKARWGSWRIIARSLG